MSNVIISSMVPLFNPVSSISSRNRALNLPRNASSLTSIPNANKLLPKLAELGSNGINLISLPTWRRTSIVSKQFVQELFKRPKIPTRLAISHQPSPVKNLKSSGHSLNPSWAPTTMIAAPPSSLQTMTTPPPPPLRQHLCSCISTVCLLFVLLLWKMTQRNNFFLQLISILPLLSSTPWIFPSRSESLIEV